MNIEDFAEIMNAVGQRMGVEGNDIGTADFGHIVVGLGNALIDTGHAEEWEYVDGGGDGDGEPLPVPVPEPKEEDNIVHIKRNKVA